MEIHELRKILSNNKKYKYIYQLWMNGYKVAEKKTSEEYSGCIINTHKEVNLTFFSADNITLALTTFWAAKKKDQSIALTFEALKQLKSITI